MDETELVPIYSPDFEPVYSYQDLVDRIDRLEDELKRLHAHQLRRQPVYQVNFSQIQSKKYNNWVDWFVHECIPG